MSVNRRSGRFLVSAVRRFGPVFRFRSKWFSRDSSPAYCIGSAASWPVARSHVPQARTEPLCVVLPDGFFADCRRTLSGSPVRTRSRLVISLDSVRRGGGALPHPGNRLSAQGPSHGRAGSGPSHLPRLTKY